MTLSVRERSTYYKGLLVLTRRDRVIDTRERKLLMRIGSMFDFDTRFCEAAIDDVLRNEHIKDDPILFLNEDMAKCFLQDGLRLAMADGEMHPCELEWLRHVARANHVTPEWLEAEITRMQEGAEQFDPSSPLAVQQQL